LGVKIATDEEMRKAKHSAWLMIAMNVSTKVFLKIQITKVVHVVWSKLKALSEESTAAHKMNLRLELNGLKQLPNEPCRVHYAGTSSNCIFALHIGDAELHQHINEICNAGMQRDSQGFMCDRAADLRSDQMHVYFAHGWCTQTMQFCYLRKPQIRTLTSQRGALTSPKVEQRPVSLVLLHPVAQNPR
jgi:hypothetical protein